MQTSKKCVRVKDGTKILGEEGFEKTAFKLMAQIEQALEGCPNVDYVIRFRGSGGGIYVGFVDMNGNEIGITPSRDYKDEDADSDGLVTFPPPVKED